MGDKAQRIGCIGAGILGHAIMQRILECGFPTVVWNRSRDKTADLIAAGAGEADSPSELCRQVDVVVTCVTDGAAVEQVVFAEQGVAEAGAADKLLIDIMLKDPELIHDLAREHGAAMPVTALVTALHHKLCADGLGERDNSEMVRLYC